MKRWLRGLGIVLVVSMLLTSVVSAECWDGWQLPQTTATIVIPKPFEPGTLGSIFDVVLGGVEEGYSIWNGTWVGWCADSTVDIYVTWSYPTRIFSSLDPDLETACPTCADDEHWDKINYLLNHKAFGASWGEIQAAIWQFSDAVPVLPLNWQQLSGYSQTRVDAMIGDADANGAGFCPAPGQIAAVILPVSAEPAQLVFIEVRQPVAALGDFVWYDSNGNGIQDDDESGITGVTVNLYDCNGTFVDTTTTDANGYYLFDGLKPGSYKVEFITPAGYILSQRDQGSDDALDSDADSSGMTACVTLVAGETNLTIDAGMYQLICSDETAWAYGGALATPNNTVPGNKSKNWGWTNLVERNGTYNFDLYAGAGQNDITKGTKVGTVTVVYEAGCVTVTYQVRAPYSISEAHLWVGKTPLPLKKNVPTDAPGQFPYRPSISADGLGASYQVCGVNKPFYVAAHSVIDLCKIRP